MYVRDEDAIQSLIAFGARHRLVIAWWLMKNHDWVDVTPGFNHAKPDKNALALEVFAQYMAQLECLQMAYFALRDKAKNRRKSLLAIYQDIAIREHFRRAKPSPKEYSGRRILLELRRISVERFRQHLGLPIFEELAAAACGKPPGAKRLTKREYNKQLRTLIDWIRHAVANKKHRHMVKAFMKMKHGFPVLGHPESDEVFVVYETKQRTSNMCVARVLPLNNSPEFLKTLEEDTALVGFMVIKLFRLYLRCNPWQDCEACTSCEARG